MPDTHHIRDQTKKKKKSQDVELPANKEQTAETQETQ